MRFSKKIEKFKKYAYKFDKKLEKRTDKFIKK